MPSVNGLVEMRLDRTLGGSASQRHNSHRCTPSNEQAATQTREVHSHIHCALDTYRCFLCTRLGPYAHLPPLMRTSKSTLDLEVNHAVACVRIA